MIGGTMMRYRHFGWVLLIALALAGCSKSSQPAKVDSRQPTEETTPAPTSAVPANPTPSTTTPSAAATAQQADRGIKTEMRNVLFHLTPQAAAHLQILSGSLWPAGKNDIVTFDDKTSFEVRVENGTVSISPAALSDIMNTYVFAKSDAPLKDLTVSIDKGRLIIKGKLHKKGDIPFATAGNLSVSTDGRIRVHTEKITAMKVPVKGLMGLFGVELANLVNTSKIPGMDTDKNDLLMDLGTLLPPPHIRGKLTGVKVENNAIVTTFGDGGRSLPPSKEKGGFMAFQGNPVKFGKMVMDPADLFVLDLDPGDSLEWDQDHYKEQLEAGYSKITSTFGLRAYAKDYSKLGRGTVSPTAKPPTQ
jgi:hypothetical protein